MQKIAWETIFCLPYITVDFEIQCLLITYRFGKQKIEILEVVIMFKKINGFMERNQNKIWMGFLAVALVLFATSIYLENNREVITIQVVSDASNPISTAPSEFEKEVVEAVMTADYSQVSTEPTNYELVQNLQPVEKETLDASLQKKFVSVDLVNFDTNEDYRVTVVEGPTLVLQNIGDVTRNTKYIAELKDLEETDDKMRLVVETKMPISEVYYTVTSKSNGMELYRGKENLVHLIEGKVKHTLQLNKTVFEKSGFCPEWENEIIEFHFASGYDSSIQVQPNFPNTKKLVSMGTRN